jgi:site-specific recombinase XerD
MNAPPDPPAIYAYRAALVHLGNHIGRWRMTDIGPADVAKYVSVKQNENLKGSTIKSDMTALSQVFLYSARHLGLVGNNPVSLNNWESPALPPR